jgi:hypothetical protein
VADSIRSVRQNNVANAIGFESGGSIAVPSSVEFDQLSVPVKAIGSKPFCSSALKVIAIRASVETFRPKCFSSGR